MLTTAENAHTKLLKYYCKMTPLYSIASALDLHINMHYFCCEQWKKSLIDEWKNQMEHIWEKEYKPVNAVIKPPTSHDADDFINSIYKKKQHINVNDELEWWVLFLCFLVGLVDFHSYFSVSVICQRI